MRLAPRDLFKFAVLVGFCAIFVDAAIAHGLFWDNDPYWTYWITKTFLITTVFAIGTAIAGTGIAQGLAITAVHTLILEVYYQWLAPVGLPQEPEWLDFNHLWTTGVPVHYLTILAGYFLALWIWRRRIARVEPATPGPVVVLALVAALVAIVVDALVTQLLVVREFFGITFLVQRLLIGFVFLYAWFVYVGSDRSAWIAGSILLALVWTTYSMYLGPVGLPHDPPRYLEYGDLWLKGFPVAAASVALALLVVPRILRHGPGAATAALALLAVGTVLPEHAEAAGLPASARASGDGMVVVGADPVDMTSTAPMSGEIAIAVVEDGNRWSHVQNVDFVDVTADFQAHGSRWRVVVDRPMPRHPHGRYTTWNGVVYNHEMHGDTGIGTGKLPKMKPEIALWGWGRVERDGALVHASVPVHVMVSSKDPMKGVMLEVDTEDKALPGAPNGYLHAMWPEAQSLSMPLAQTRTRNLVGWLGIAAFVLGFGWLARREEDVAGRAMRRG